MSAPTPPAPHVASPVAIVTGASQGLGLALADALADRGWALVIDARRSERLDAALERLSERTTVAGVVGDVTDPAHRAELARVAASLGTVGVLVNNASTLGASPLPALDAIEPDTFLRIFDVNGRVVGMIARDDAMLGKARQAAAGVVLADRRMP